MDLADLAAANHGYPYFLHIGTPGGWVLPTAANGGQSPPYDERSLVSTKHTSQTAEDGALVLSTAGIREDSAGES